jgi:AcrR family transcriptional regulator
MVAPKKMQTLTREDWLAAALDALEESGADGLKVLPLALRLGVTRGSFYWHFRDRAELLEAVLDYWDRWSTQVVIDALDSSQDDPLSQLQSLMEMVEERRLTRYEPAMRAWAVQDAEAARAVRRVDRRRLAYVTGLLRKAGFSADQADARARLFAVYLSADPIFFAPEPAARRRQLLRLRHRILTER